MMCPRCNTTVLDERERQGVVVDVCPSCRGVWLDRGELEKLMTFAKRDLEEERAYHESHSQGRHRDSEPPSSRPRGSYDRGHVTGPRQGYPHRKKSWLENLGDIFD